MPTGEHVERKWWKDTEAVFFKLYRKLLALPLRWGKRSNPADNVGRCNGLLRQRQAHHWRRQRRLWIFSLHSGSFSLFPAWKLYGIPFIVYSDVWCRFAIVPFEIYKTLSMVCSYIIRSMSIFSSTTLIARRFFVSFNQSIISTRFDALRTITDSFILKWKFRTIESGE